MKLPDINYNRAVPELRSVKAAALPGKLANINAKVKGFNSATTTAYDLVDTAFEKEAKLDAGRRFQRAQREFTEDHASLVQEYHTSNKPLDQFASDLDSLRRKNFDNANKGMSSRSEKYLAPKLDQFSTGINTAQVKSMQVLAESRSIQHMEMAHRDNLALASGDPTDSGLTIALGNMNDMLTDNGLGQVYNQEQKAKMTTGIFREILQKNLLAGDFTGAVALTERAAWNDIPQAQRLAMEGEIHKMSLEQMDSYVQETSNALVLGQNVQLEPLDTLDTEVLWTQLNDIPGMVESDTMLEGESADTFAKAIEGDLAVSFFQGQVELGNAAHVLEELRSGNYNKILEPAQTKALIKSAKQGGVTKDLNRNIERSKSGREVKDVIAALAINPATSAASVAAAHAQIDSIHQSYLDNGETPAREVDTLRADLNRAYDDANTTLSVWKNPGYAAQHRAQFTDNSPEAVRQRDVADAALESRAKMLATDAIDFARKIDMPIKELPPIGSGEYAAALSHRLGQFGELTHTFGEDLSGPLSAAEADDVMVALNQGGVDGLLAFAGSLTDTLGAEGSLSIWDQLNKSDDNSVIPVAGRMAANGQEQAATHMLTGEQWLNESGSTFKPAEMTKVRAGIREELGQAFGVDSLSAARHQKAALAYYSYLLGSPESRGDFSYNPDLAEAAVQAVSGGTLEMNGRTVIAPARGVTQQNLDYWRDAIGPDDLPVVQYADGNIMPAQDLADGLDRVGFGQRYQLVEQGSPGIYYIMDSSSSNMGGSMGGFLFDGSDGHKKGQLATIRYDPTLSVSPRRRSKYRN